MIRHKFVALVATGAFVTLGSTALAQQSPMQQGQMQQSPAQQSPMQQGQMQPTGSRTSMLSAADKQFLTTTAEDSVYEFSSAQLAVQRAQRPEVAQYALRIMGDHAQFNKALMQLARQKGLTLPVTLSSKDRDKLDRLMQLHGAAFDRQYIQEVAKANATSVTELNRAAKITKDQDMQNFIATFLPVDQQHLQLANALQNGSASSGAGMTGSRTQ